MHSTKGTAHGRGQREWLGVWGMAWAWSNGNAWGRGLARLGGVAWLGGVTRRGLGAWLVYVAQYKSLLHFSRGEGCKSYS